MSLVAAFEDMFPDSVRRRGEGYVSRVRVAESSGSRVAAYVRGSASSPYRVTLTPQERQLSMYCNCPYFESDGPCKHLWAVMLAVDRQNPFSNAERHMHLVHMTDDSDWLGVQDDGAAKFWNFQNPSAKKPSASPHSTKERVQPDLWRKHLSALVSDSSGSYSRWRADEELVYIIDFSRMILNQESTIRYLELEFGVRRRKQDGDWSKPLGRAVRSDEIEHLPNERDKDILGFIFGARGESYSSYYQQGGSRVALSGRLLRTLLPIMCEEGRCFARVKPEDTDTIKPSNRKSELVELRWDGEIAWRFRLKVGADAQRYQVQGEFERDGVSIDISLPRFVFGNGFIFHEQSLLRTEDASSSWLWFLRKEKQLEVPALGRDELSRALYESKLIRGSELPHDLQLETIQVAPKPQVHIRKPERRDREDLLTVELWFDYDGNVVEFEESSGGIFLAEKRAWIMRDEHAEQQARQVLLHCGVHEAEGWDSRTNRAKVVFRLHAKKLPSATQQFLHSGWHVEADGNLYRQASSFDIGVSSGIDWFDVHGTASFGTLNVPLPELLKAWKQGEHAVRLDDGTYGVLPEEWLAKYGILGDVGKVEGDHLRFSRIQVGLLDALLATMPEAKSDHVFDRIRADLTHFSGVKPITPPKSFVGTLRRYQKEGLGWFEFLRKLGAGGCLADDMGLGKTVQVLGLLESRRLEDNPRPSLAVVPRSLIFNWKNEASRFTPKLRVVDCSGKERVLKSSLDDADLVLTTYGTMRRDIATLSQEEFDYVILDEANAIKNEKTEAAKAARLLRARYRLALSGTPIENHLGELWSLFEFLNPGLMGTGAFLKVGGKDYRNPSENTRAFLSRLLRPFILRRTKDQVAKELPEKNEQIVYCDFDPKESKRYDELRDYYRSTLQSRIEEQGLMRSKIHVLEALLRLRQASCHHGLVDKTRTDETSPKLEALIPMIQDVVEGGRKAIVFSQFTSLLQIVKKRLEGAGIPYEYLDGKTRDREAKVKRFQADSSCPVFLLSLKAGGVGLNLTAAEYVFLLDPWWNPAVESQAIDRAHRIGQRRSVFVYRIVTRNTIEEKVLALQATKRNLAEDILNEGNALIRNLTREDLEALLS